jgi:hypothetical protein
MAILLSQLQAEYFTFQICHMRYASESKYRHQNATLLTPLGQANARNLLHAYYDRKPSLLHLAIPPF